MSYEIIYDKQFIKAEKNGVEVFLPIIYCGSNNCIQYDRSNRGRRERSWFLTTYLLKGKRFGTLQEFIDGVNAERQRLIERNEEEKKECEAKGDMSWFTPYSDERWGYFTSMSFGGGCKSTFGQYKGLYTTGCKKALTVEELLEFGVDVHLYTSIYSEEAEKKFKEAGKEQIDFYPKTSKELLEKLDEFDEYLKDTSYVSLYVSIDADERNMKDIRRRKFPKKKTENINVNTLPEYYVIKDTVDLHYIIRFTRRGYKYSWYGTCSCKRFVDKKAAERYAKRANKSYGQDRFIVETIVNKKEGVAV